MQWLCVSRLGGQSCLLRQVNTQRERAIAHIEALAAKLRRSGECNRWFADADPEVARVCMLRRTPLDMQCGAGLGRLRVVSMGRCWSSSPVPLTTMMLLVWICSSGADSWCGGWRAATCVACGVRAA